MNEQIGGVLSISAGFELETPINDKLLPKREMPVILVTSD